MRWLPLALIFLLAYIEISIFIKVAAVLGVLVTLLLVIFSSCVGISLVRNQGIKTFMQMQQKLAAGESPAAEMVKSVSLVLAGFLLLIPASLPTSSVCCCFCLRFKKSLTLKLMPHLNIYRGGFSAGGFNHNNSGPMGGGNTFDGEFQRKTDDHFIVEHRPDEDDKSTDSRFKDDK